MSSILTKEEMRAVSTRNQIIFGKEIELSLLKREKEIMMESLFSKYGLDKDKQYGIDERGVISERASSRVKNEPRGTEIAKPEPVEAEPELAEQKPEGAAI